MKTLYVVGTPIGNLADITFRAVEILKTVQFILAEDSRETAKLLHHYGIKTQVVSYRDQNHDRMITKIKEKLDMGLDLALVSDAGTPTISDPGYKLVQQLKNEGYMISPIPGPAACIAALSASGITTDKFVFLGFLPKSFAKRHDVLKKYIDLEAAIIIYESPKRLVNLLAEIKNLVSARKVCIANDITKLYERIDTMDIEDIVKRYSSESNVKGEYVVIIDKSGINP